MPQRNGALRFAASRIRFGALRRSEHGEPGSSFAPGALVSPRPHAGSATDYFFIGSSETAIAWVYVTSTLSPGLILPS